MAQKKNYSRYFIILQEDEKGYATSTDKLPSGYLKLENKNEKCKVSYYVQNLKKEPAPYYMILICNKKEVKKIIKIGELNIDDYGRADIAYEYPIDNIGGSKISMDKISGAAIVKLLDSNIISVMSGFASTDIPQWKGFEMVDNSIRIKEDEKHVENNSIFDEYEKSIEAVKIVNKEDKTELEQSKKTTKENETYEDEPMQDEPKVDESKYEEKINTVDVNREPIKDELNTEKETEKENITYADDNQSANRNKNKNPLGAVGEFFRDISEGLEELKELSHEIKRCTWYKVNIKNINDMYNYANYNKFTVLYYPMISYYPYIKQYGHYVIGYKCNSDGKIKYLVYGIPGKKCRQEQPYGGKSGFVTWIPLEEGIEGENSMGYWLMFYDFRNSTILIPVK